MPDVRLVRQVSAYEGIRESRATFSSSTSTPSTASMCPPLAFTNQDLTVETLLPDSLNDHSQATFELFSTVQETARGWVSTIRIFISTDYMYVAASGAGGGAKPTVNVMFLKIEEGTPSTSFLSSANPRSSGVVRTKCQQGGCHTISGCVLRCLITRLARATVRVSLNPSLLLPLFVSPSLKLPRRYPPW